MVRVHKELAAEPDIFVVCCQFVSEYDVAACELSSSEARSALGYWPPPWGSQAATRKLLKDYVGASVKLRSNGYYNFIVHRKAFRKIRKEGYIRFGR